MTVESRFIETSSAGGLVRRRPPIVLWWVLLALTVGALVVVNVFHLPPIGRRLLVLAGDERILDMRAAGYSPVDVHRLLAALGAGGRRLYLELLWTLDLAFPALFSSFLWTSISLGALSRWRWMGLLGGAADYLENASVTVLLLAFPGEPWGTARLAGVLTVSKFAMYLAGLVLAAAGAIAGGRANAGRASVLTKPQ